MDPSLHNPSNVFSSLPIDHSSPKKKDSYRATNPISGSRLHINNTSGNTAPSMYNQLMDTDRRSHETTDVSIGRNQFVSSQSPRELAQRGLDDMALTQIGLPSSAMSSNGESYMDSQHVNNSNDNSNNNNTPFTSGIVTGNREEALLESSRSPVARPQLYDMNGAAYKEVEGSAQLAAGQIVDRQDDYPIYYPADASRPVAHHNTINMETSPSELLSNNDRNGDTPWPIRYTSSSHYPPPRIDTSVYYHPSSVGQEELVGDDARLGSAYMSAARRNYYSNSPIPPESSRNGWHSSPVARPPHALPEHCICCGMMAPQFNSGESFDPALLCQNCQDLWLDVGVRCMTCSWIPSREDTERLSYCPRCHAPGWSLDPTVGVERAHRLSSRSRYSYPYPPEAR
ncbi:hypothetical protein BDF22DRAFT_181778 [Syncephalis plumigaleata]|nr:hypothetical protein BDF22DRAFT_181778 [Syncephalis plumigaleata]